MKLANLIYESPLGGLLLVVLAILFTLCAGPANAASEAGTVIIVGSAEPTNIDPDEAKSVHPGHILPGNITETLTEIHPQDGTIVPKLATSWKQVDANTWHFVLRTGVKFHDGEDFNAKAIAFNVQRMYATNRGLIPFTRDHFFPFVKMQVKALDSHAVEIKTDKPEPLLLYSMSNFALCSPNTPMDKVARIPIGTGPYKFVKWEAGSQMILERFDGYWGKQPQVKKAVYLWRNESSVRAAMVLIGEADLTPNIAKQDANRPDMDYAYLNTETSFLRIGGKWDPPLNDRRVRMALNLAVDRNAIRGSILSRDVIPATHIYMPSIFGHNPDLKVWPYDPQKARQLLDEARKDGVPVDREILLVGRIGYFPGTEELMEAMLSMYKSVGLNVKLRMLEVGVYHSYNRKPYPPEPYLVEKLHDNGFGDAVFSLRHNFDCKGRLSSICDEKVDDMIMKGEVTTGEERKKYWLAVAKRINDEIIPNVLLFHMVAYARGGKRIDFKPALATAGELRLAQITFK